MQQQEQQLLLLLLLLLLPLPHTQPFDCSQEISHQWQQQEWTPLSMYFRQQLEKQWWWHSDTHISLLAAGDNSLAAAALATVVYQ